MCRVELRQRFATTIVSCYCNLQVASLKETNKYISKTTYKEFNRHLLNTA